MFGPGMQYNGIPCNKMQYNVIPKDTTRCNIISFIARKEKPRKRPKEPPKSAIKEVKSVEQDFFFDLGFWEEAAQKATEAGFGIGFGLLSTNLQVFCDGRNPKEKKVKDNVEMGSQGWKQLLECLPSCHCLHLFPINC